MSVVVRPVADAELAEAVAIMIAGSLDDVDETPDNLAPYARALEAARAEGSEVLVAIENGTVVGVSQLIVFTHLQHGGRRCAELESVHVRGDRRSRGIGAAMISAAEALARERGCYRIQLTSRNIRVDAHRFYLANGYIQSHQGFKKTLG